MRNGGVGSSSGNAGANISTTATTAQGETQPGTDRLNETLQRKHRVSWGLSSPAAARRHCVVVLVKDRDDKR